MQDWALSTSQEHRGRLLRGMAAAVAVKGYADTTIADVVREASVSRRTFYEHFRDKAECLIALYEAASRNALGVLREAIDPGLGWEEQVERAIRAYLECLASNPLLLRTLFVEILGLGPEGLEVRRAMHREIAEFLMQLVNAGTAPHASMTPEIAIAVIGGMHELVLQAIEDGKLDELPVLTATATRLLKAVTRV
ncbi:TetR/AcrR family transcriptional regulator [Ramlibacter alkalitolerans]|uniref:TetR/AcrR family transcriptional regulator n=1 Tax=Ramlibacter alkalitolerans TaxID=2039631 RepID=A0ABS1JK99_9BURK|nr:TetR/AcrR family transcriptional regulator [Ramlibacter alkalitolerans]MBL0424655.1 TetR/AcrR family transcriptional regulator [Ramlibacter alkalitolerans]